MQIGKLDRRIVYQNYGTTTNDFGELIENYGEANEVWAKVEFDGGSQKDEFDRITAISKVHFYIRNIGLNNFTEKTRITYDSKFYFVESINEIEGRERFLKITTEERQ